MCRGGLLGGKRDGRLSARRHTPDNNFYIQVRRDWESQLAHVMRAPHRDPVHATINAISTQMYSYVRVHKRNTHAEYSL